MTTETAFSAQWLALREPADHAATNGRLRQTLLRWLGNRQRLTIVDLGSGTGSNLRSLSDDIPIPHQRWHLVDYDQRLLQHAQAPRRGIDLTVHHRDLSDGHIADLLDDCDLVTASALFDLVSTPVIDKMTAQITAQRLPFYTALTYDGIAAWLPAHPLDTIMQDTFNAHQRTDKGFGPAAGPDATKVLCAAFEAAGYQVTSAASPWLLDDAYAQLRLAVDEGFADAVRETGTVADADLDDWLAYRRTIDRAVTIIGHRDLLALPPES
jgi:Methyltransferase domain